MFLLGVFVYFCVLGQHECFQPDRNSNELRQAEWECDSVCVGSGGEAAFDSKNKICKCTLDKNTDDMEKQLILKNSKLLRVPLVIRKDIVKRQVNSNSPQEHILGQRTPSRIITPRPMLWSTTRRPFQLTTNRAFGTTRRFTTPRINIDAQGRLQEIQKRINEWRRNTARSRTGPHLQQRARFPDESGPNLMERLRQIQKERQEKQRNRTAASTTAAPNVAAPAPRINAAASQSPGIVAASQSTTGKTSKKSKNQGANVNGKNSNVELITQDPSLYDKDD